MSQKVEKVKKGGGATSEIKKSTIQNVDFLNEVDSIFQVFPKFKLMKYSLDFDIGETKTTFGAFMADI